MAKKSENIDLSIACPGGTYLLFVEKVESTRTKTKLKNGVQSGGDPMAVLDLQIVAPDVMETPAGRAQAAGRTLKWYLAFTPRNATPVKQAELLLGTEVAEEYDEFEDIIKPLAALAGTVFEAELESKPYFETDNGKWDGVVIKDEQGNPKVKGHRLEFKRPLGALHPLPAGLKVQPY
jgi:hypothetical protein